LKKPLRRLFIDPGSISSGWALFQGDLLVKSGTFKQNPKQDAFHRCAQMYLDYFELGDSIQPLDEVHLEQFRKNLAMGLHYAVGTIASAMSLYCDVVKQDCWMATWQRHHGYSKKTEMPIHLDKYTQLVQSTDELEAIAIGLWYLETKA